VPLAAGAALAASGSSNSVTLCAAKRGRQLTLAVKGKCGKGTIKLTISKRGPQGPPGKDGQNGTNGQDGKDGLNGKDATPADFQPEALRLIQPARLGCEEGDDTFCYDPKQWRNYENGYAPVGYQRDRAGYVHLQGVAQTNSAAPSHILLLPQGYRPSDGKHEFVVQVCGSGTTYVDIGTDGFVVAGASCVSLDGITFHP
jgi:hypothetical protein